MDVHERLLTFIECKGLNVRQFEMIVGLSNGAVSKIGDSIRKSTIERISKAFPDLSTTWLTTGYGEMTNSKTAPVIQSTAGRDNNSVNRVGGTGNGSDNMLLKVLTERIEYQEHLIDDLLNKIILLLQHNNIAYGCER